ncbi:histidine kinase [Caulobacter flavus]|uniref:histidine kinase n=1 Tax=Caulobacter flavus TaxID=1679497 RepID=A0A2N5CN11_9CAUL|nr:HWE histidine kinase domain-containing protein [Caulobacter flavus]AYV46591.1 histidine kinase [Caulobacter flavus]PLR07827.1 histidine kinase [Caulobacter flavus]
MTVLEADAVSATEEIADLRRRLAEAQAAHADEVRRNQAFSRIAAAIGAHQSLGETVQAVIDGGVELIGAQFGAFFYNVVDKAGESYMLYGLAGAPPEAFADFPMPRKTAIFAPTFDGVGVVRSDDVTADPRYGQNAPRKGMPEGHLPVRSYLAAPVKTADGLVLGGLFFGHREPGRFDARAETVIVGLAAQAAVAIEWSRAGEAGDRELTERRRTEERLKFALDSGRLGSWELDVETRAYDASDICKSNYGRAADQDFGFDDLVATIHASDRERMLKAMDEAIRTGGDYDIEYRVVIPSGETRWVHARGRAAVRDETPVIGGGVRRMAGVSLDVTERKRAEERQRLLLNELNHRVKNTLVTVQSMAAQTLRAAENLDAFREAFEARLIALSQTHNLLTEQNWESASLREIVDAELEAFAGRERLDFDYTRDLRLNPKATVAVGMAVHELATNAAKYGALSTSEGRVTVAWSVEPPQAPGRLVLTWTERGGPPVTTPSRRGFGARLLEKGLAGELSGVVRLAYDQSGLVCAMTLPLAALEP